MSSPEVDVFEARDAILSRIAFTGERLARPECVLTTASGHLFTSDERGGVMCIAPDGHQKLLGNGALLPNGIAMLRDRSFLIANLGRDGGVWRITATGVTEPFLTEVHGCRLPPVNFVWLDSLERLWICVSTSQPTTAPYSCDANDGYIILHDRSGTRVVADGLCWTNECRIDPSGDYLYVNETFGGRLTRFHVAANGELRHRCTVTEFSEGTYPDGLALDVYGNAWIVSVVTNRLIVVSPEGRQTVVFEDYDHDRAAAIGSLCRSNSLTRPVLSEVRGEILRNITSIAFGGADLRTIYFGCLNGDTLPTLRVPIPGLPPVHWNW